MLAICRQPFLPALQAVGQQHQNQADEQRHEGGVEGDAQAGGHAGQVPGHGLSGLAQGFADAAHRAEKADRGDGPEDVLGDGQPGIEDFQMQIAGFGGGFIRLLEGSAQTDPIQRQPGAAKQQGVRQLGFRPGQPGFDAVQRRFAESAQFIQAEKIQFQQIALVLKQAVAERQQPDAPEAQDEAKLLLDVLQDDGRSALRHRAAFRGDAQGFPGRRIDVQKVEQMHQQAAGHQPDEIQAQPMLGGEPHQAGAQPGRGESSARNFH